MENESSKRRPGRPPVGETRKIFSMPPDMAQAFDDFRFERRFKTEAEALRYLIDLGLRQVKTKSPRPKRER